MPTKTMTLEEFFLYFIIIVLCVSFLYKILEIIITPKPLYEQMKELRRGEKLVEKSEERSKKEKREKDEEFVSLMNQMKQKK